MRDRQDTPAPQARRAASWRRYLQFFGARVEHDVDDELAFHVDMLVRDLMAHGMSAADARAAAVRRFGDVRRARDACLDIGHRRRRRTVRARIVDDLRQDLGFAVRLLGRQRGWTAIAVLTLALGIGASTAVFSVVDAIVLRPLPYTHADRLMLLMRTDRASAMMLSPEDDEVDAWRRSAHSLEAVEQFAQSSVTLTGRGDPTVLVATSMQRDLPNFAGIPLLFGRTFSPREVADSTARVVILGEGLWRERFAGSRDVLGRTITLDEKPYTIIGVASSRLRVPAFNDKGATQIWLPLPPKASFVAHLALARLQPGVTVAAAEHELATIQQRIPSVQQSSSREFSPKLVPPGRFDGWRDSLVLLSIAVALLLLISCANVAHLLLARGAARERELAIRRTLGASRGRIARQLLTENVLLSAAGCVSGLAMAKAGLRAFTGLRPTQAGVDQLAAATLDGRVLGLALLLALSTALVFGTIAALHATRHDGAESLRGAGRTGTETRRAYRVRALLVMSEMELSTMLLVGAVLLVRSVIKLQQVDPGFDTRDLYSMEFQLPTRLMRDTGTVNRLADQALDGALKIPGVRAATVAATAPPNGGYLVGQLQLADGRTPNGDQQFNAMNRVRPAFFRMLGIRIVQGRGFDAGSAARHEAVINAGMARTLWPGQSPLGERFRISMFRGAADQSPWWTVVGVTANTVTRGLSEDRDDPYIYYPSAIGSGWTGFTLLVRTSPGVAIANSLKRLSLSLDKTLAPPPVESLSQAFDESIATQRFTMAVLSLFAVLAVVLSAIGLYGVISYVVAQRTREIGIRVALGATPRHVARLVMAGGVFLAVAGLATGLVASLWGTTLIRSTLYGVTTTDPVSFAAGGALLLGVSVLACVVPMRRALRVDPAIAMQAE